MIDLILDLLFDINERFGLIIVFIIYEMYVICKICNRVVVMENGKVVEEGEVFDVFKNLKEDMIK